ncbi:MAG: 2-oxoacid:acceptor oxidoreductase family protein [Actinomycetaceae bacterium]|nr:2-oxoacid:acceptor oxidoreductase family protein [Actinomycetaceae bacterium]
MVEIRIHGRGGQGVVTASDLIAYAAFAEGSYAQAFPSFGSERTGAPVVSYCRIRDTKIRTREPVMYPDVVIVQDQTLLPIVDVFGGLTDDGYALINSKKTLEELGLGEFAAQRPRGHVVTVPASDIAREYTGRTVPNAVLLGALAALTELYTLESVSTVIKQRFQGEVGQKNADAARAAYDYVMQKKEEARDAATN